MQLNHLNLAVVDVAATRTFFETFFGFRCLEEKGAGVLAVLEDTAGFSLIVSNFHKGVTPDYPPDFHIGFLLDTVEKVQAVYDQLERAGVTIQHAPRKMRESIGFYCYAPGPILLEVSAFVPIEPPHYHTSEDNP